MIQLLRHIHTISELVTKKSIKQAMETQRRRYRGNVGTEDKFRISILLNNAFNNLNKNHPNEAIENIMEIREHLSRNNISNHLRRW